MSDKAEARDPKEAMREALERKKNANNKANLDATQAEGKVTGGPHGPAAAKRVFRRKSGG